MAIALDSTAFESTINIVCVSFGGMAMLLMWKSWITTRRWGNVWLKDGRFLPSTQGKF